MFAIFLSFLTFPLEKRERERELFILHQLNNKRIEVDLVNKIFPETQWSFTECNIFRRNRCGVGAGLGTLRLTFTPFKNIPFPPDPLHRINNTLQLEASPLRYL
jgi:hypothetical protein